MKPVGLLCCPLEIKPGRIDSILFQRQRDDEFSCILGNDIAFYIVRILQPIFSFCRPGENFPDSFATARIAKLRH
jgi:hypothetical protein